MRRKAFWLVHLVLGAFGPIFTASAQTDVQHTDVKLLIVGLDKALTGAYVYPDQARLIGKHLKQRLREGAYRNITDNRALAEKISADMQLAHQDGHLSLGYDPEMNPDPATRTPADTARALQRQRARNFSFREVENLDGNIGYLRFNGFSPFTVEAKPTIDAAMQFLAHSEAIIIDLRGNRGGSPEMVKVIASYFYAERTHLNDIYTRSTGETIEGWTDPALANGVSLAMPLYILTAKETFSAAEDLTYAMQANKRAVVVGERTGGGAHPTRSVPINQGFVARIPHKRTFNVITKTDWEGTGVVPDVAVPADQALDTVRSLLLAEEHRK